MSKRYTKQRKKGIWGFRRTEVYDSTLNQWVNYGSLSYYQQAIAQTDLNSPAKEESDPVEVDIDRVEEVVNTSRSSLMTSNPVSWSDAFDMSSPPSYRGSSSYSDSDSYSGGSSDSGDSGGGFSGGCGGGGCD